VQHPHFDAERFCALVEQFNGLSSVRMIGHFLRNVFDANPLPLLLGEYSYNRELPRQIGFRGAWAAIGTAREWMLGLNHNGILQRIGTNRIVMSTANESFSYVIDTNTQSRSERAIVHTLSGVQLKVRLHIIIEESNLKIQVHLPLLDDERLEYRIRVDDAYNNTHHAVNIDSCAKWHHNSNGRVTVAPSDGDYGTDVLLPSKEASQTFLLTVARRNKRTADFYNAECLIVMPFHIEMVQNSLATL
jgi:hypothetical protein